MKALDINVLLTIICWGLWGIADKKALEHSGKEEVILRLYLISFLFIPVAYFVLNIYYPGWKLSPEILFWAGLASVSYTVSMFAYLAAMSETEASYVLGITAAYPLIFQFLAHIFLGEELLGQRLFGAGVIAAGLFLIGGSAGENSQEQTGNKISLRTTICVCIATLSWGVYGLFDKKAVAVGSPLEIYFAKSLWDFVCFCIILPILASRKKLDWKQKQTWFYCALSEIALAGGGLTYLAALSAFTASYVISITGCYPLLMYVFAIWFLKEKFNRNRFIGIIFVVIGGVVVQLVESK